ncbi:hypothetical protein AB4072_09055 [Microvirga sp. 2MCAF38]
MRSVGIPSATDIAALLEDNRNKTLPLEMLCKDQAYRAIAGWSSVF